MVGSTTPHAKQLEAPGAQLEGSSRYSPHGWRTLLCVIRTCAAFLLHGLQSASPCCSEVQLTHGPLPASITMSLRILASPDGAAPGT